MDDIVSLAEHEDREPIVAYPVCVRPEFGAMQMEEMATYHIAAQPFGVSVADDGTVMVDLADGRTLTIGPSKYVTYCQNTIGLGQYKDGRWSMDPCTAECVAEGYVDEETDVPLPTCG